MASFRRDIAGSSDGNMKVWTYSIWFKRAKLGQLQFLLSNGEDYSGEGKCYIDADDRLFFLNDNVNGSANKPTRVLRDTNAWYHLVWKQDVTESSNDDRWKIYLNGELIPASDYGSPTIANADGVIQRYSLIDFWIGENARTQQGSGIYPFYGSMSHIHFIDGTAYDATAFGEYDANGVWKIKTDVSVTYGNNGFFILKDGNSVTDQSGEGNNWTVGGGTLTNTEDSPSNVFATLNPLHRGNELGRATFSNGNTKHEGTSGGGYYPYSNSTLASSSGKYYAEFKQIQGDSMMGISDGKANAWPGSGTNDYVIYKGGEVFNNGTSESWGNAISNNVIVGVAMDLDNNAVYWSLNGVWQNSGNPTSGSSRTGGKQITAPSSTFSGVYHFMCGKGGSGVTDIQANFGNGYFGTTAVSSAGTNASGIGIFEYDVPTGYTALSTKGLNL